MKTVLIFSWFYLPYVGGAELFVKAITDRLGGRFRFIIVTARADAALARTEGGESDPVRVVRTGIGRSIDKFTYPVPALVRGLSLPEVDVVHSIMVNAAAVAAYGLTRVRRRPTLLTLQEGDSEAYVRDWLGPLFPVYPRLHRPFDRIHAISQHLKSQAVHYGADANAIDVVPNGVDADLFAPGPPDGELRDELDLANKRVVVSLSRLVPKNGLDTVVDALPKLLESLPDTVVVLVGDGDERKALERRAQELSVRHALRFVGTIAHEKTVAYLRLADAFVRPSRSEGLGSAFLESMAAGVPVVATPVGGIPDFLRHEENGLLVEPDAPDAVADALARLLTDRALADRLAETARALVVSDYSWDSVAERIGAIYDELASA